MKQLIFSTKSLSRDGTAFLARVIPGTLLFYHGMNKIINYQQFSEFFPDPIGIGSQLSLLLVISVEAVGGILLTIGLFTRFSLVPIFVAMTVALFIAHAGDPFEVKQPALLLWLMVILSFTAGPGRFSLDYFIGKSRSVLSREESHEAV